MSETKQTFHSKSFLEERSLSLVILGEEHEVRGIFSKSSVFAVSGQLA